MTSSIPAHLEELTVIEFTENLSLGHLIFQSFHVSRNCALSVTFTVLISTNVADFYVWRYVTKHVKNIDAKQQTQSYLHVLDWVVLLVEMPKLDIKR